MRRALLVTLAGTLAGCAGLFDPRDQIACDKHVYLANEPLVIDCPGALSAVRNAENDTGINLSTTPILFAAGADLSFFGHPEANGETLRGMIVVLALTPAVVVHEAYHIRDGQNDHCGWSAPARLAVFESARVPGWYVDECAHVTCKSTFTYIDGVGQEWGFGWKCQ